jgi:hypothetical protein
MESFRDINSEKKETIHVNNKIYHCKVCQRLFLELNAFRKHICENNHNRVALSNDYLDKPDNRVLLGKNDIYCDQETTDGENDIKVKKMEKQENNSLHNFNYLQEILKHPLVIKTLQELYGHEDLKFFEELYTPSIKGISSNFFYMCTTCGYRGNTARGVKQHGKLHLINKQHFAIIHATKNQPILIYNSENDSFDTKTSRENIQKANLNFEKHIDIVETSIKLNENKTPDFYKSKLPLSKKARLLHDYSKSLKEQECEKQEDISLKVVKAHTYCFKCNIQFQHLNNYLTHKKTYCIDK